MIPAVVIALLAAPSHLAYGQYIDPGTGSYLFQLFLAGLLASLFYLKQIGSYVKSLFRRFVTKEHENQGKDNVGD
jgi:hypothetical protein